MDHTTDQDVQEPRSTDPSRFDGLQRRPQAATKRRAGELIGSGLALLALVIGLPVALLVLAGPPPIPTSVPSVRDLVQQMSIEDVLTILVGIVWLAWAYFLVCVAVEIVAARRGGLAKTVPLAGPLQKLAQALVGALLLTGLMAGNAQAATDAGSATAPVSSSSSVTAGWDSSATGEFVEVAAESDAGSDAASTVSAEAGRFIGEKVYTVAAPKDGYHDNLWDIAERHLGDGLRYKEIYELNKDKAQPDGRKLELARLIQPGWTLVMPDDATGLVRTPAPEPTPVTPQGSSAVDTAAGADTAAATDAGSQAGALQENSNWMAGAGLLAAGVIAALVLQRRRGIGRRPEDDALEAEAEFRFAASQARCSWLDQALRQLSVSCRNEGLALPPLYAAVADDTSVELLLAPAAAKAPEGWTVLEDGRRWRRERVESETDLPATDVAPYPALVSVGLDEAGRDVLVDLESAGGVIAIGGDPTIAQEFAAALAVQSATAPWSDAVQVVATELPEGMTEIGDARINIVDDLQQILTGFEEQITSLRDEVLTGRTKRRGTVASHLIVSGASPDQAVADRLTALTGRGRQALSVVVAGEHRSARWRLSVDENGTLTIPALGLTVVANRLSGRHVDALAELFAATRQVDETESKTDRVAISEPLRRFDDAMWTTAARRVGVLGRVTVQGAGELPADRSDLATELVTYLALHPEGVHPKVLAGVLWPRGVSDDVVKTTIERARAWLGTDVDGSHHLREDSAGRLSVSDRVVCDWDCVRNLFLASRKATGAEEVDLLRRALKMVRGEVFDGVPERRYGWVAHNDLTRTMQRVVIDGAHRLSQLLNDADDAAGAAQAAESGLRINPGSQVLWRELLRARYTGTGIAGVKQTLDAMGEALQGIPLEAETEALVEEYLPDTGANAAV